MSNLNDSKKMMKAAWFTWEIQVRNRSMANQLGITLYELTSKKSRGLKYPLLILKTIYLIFSQRIDCIFAQNPSIVLSLLVTLIGKVTRKKVVIDAHNAGVYPLEGKSAFLNGVAKFIIRNADQVIVSNAYLARVVDAWGGKSFVMPDPLPVLEHKAEVEKNNQGASAIENKLKEKYFFFICTWADDEPYDEVIAAAALIPSDLHIYISGNFKKRLSAERVANLPKNIKLLGFVSEEDYIQYLSHSIAAIDLTTRDHCLVCGAYESMALGVPCVISDSIINREIFSQGFEYTHNDSVAIAKALAEVAEHRSVLVQAMQQKKQEHQSLVQEKILQLKQVY